MRIRSLAVFFICLVLAAPSLPALAADPLKKPEDFRGLRWGIPASSQPGLSVVDRDGDIIHYEIPKEKKELGGIPLQHVTYSFYKDQFYHAEIDYDGADAFDALQQALVAKYGPPDAVREKKDPNGHPYEVATWNWPGYAFIGNRHDKDSPHGRIFYFYAPLTDASAKAQGIAPPQVAAPKPAAHGTTEASGSGYTIQKGDSLERIAKRLGVTEDALAAANPGLTDRKLKAGALINVPGDAAQKAATPQPPAEQDSDAPDAKPRKKSEKAPASAGTTAYTVKDGDMLSKVAARYGVSTKDIIAANPGIDPKSLQLGTTLKIPAKK